VAADNTTVGVGETRLLAAWLLVFAALLREGETRRLFEFTFTTTVALALALLREGETRFVFFFLVISFFVLGISIY